MTNISLLIEELNELTGYHVENCELYRNYIKSFFPVIKSHSINDIPYIPVRAFKQFELKSISSNNVYKVMQSSGTSGLQSKIFLDKITAKEQTKALVKNFGLNFGNNRFPMLIIDCESTVTNRLKFSARTAGINGFSMFARSRCFALNDDLTFNFERVDEFLQKHKGRKIFIFGFTFLIWSAFIEFLSSKRKKIDLSNGFILHGGGWKKLEQHKVSSNIFKERIKDVTGCEQVHNYYGMVEQTGTIFIECSHGNMHASNGSAAIVRSPKDFTPLKNGETGIIQVLSTIQFSYPGHSLLTEDLGRVYPGNKCQCGNMGVIIEVDGRLKMADVRGCSDAYS